MSIDAKFIIDETVSSQLVGLVTTASFITKDTDILKLADQLRSEQRRIRPSVNSFSLVSYSERQPQLEFSDIRSASRLATKLQEPIRDPKRRTPEKEIQSWLIRSAISTRGEIVSLSQLLGGKFWFISDEPAIYVVTKDGNRIKLVPDLLLVKEDNQGRAQLVNVELKSKRTRDTFDQAMDFRQLLEHPELSGHWRQFAQSMTGKAFNWDESIITRALVIWPKASDRSRFVNIYERVDVIGYEKSYALRKE